jgi:hypothetical protein
MRKPNTIRKDSSGKGIEKKEKKRRRNKKKKKEQQQDAESNVDRKSRL